MSEVGFGRFGRMPDHVPPHSCTRCFRENVEDGFVIFGDGEWQAAAMYALAGVPEDQSVQMVRERREPKGKRYPAFVRLCTACGKLTNAPVIPEERANAAMKNGTPIPACVQPGSPGTVEGIVVEVEG